MRLDRDEVAGPQPAEVERGQDRDDRRARGLVAADLDAVACWGGRRWPRGSSGREPQDPPRDGIERRGVRPADRRPWKVDIGDGHLAPGPPVVAAATGHRVRTVRINGTRVPEYCYAHCAMRNPPGSTTPKPLRTRDRRPERADGPLGPRPRGVRRAGRVGHPRPRPRDRHPAQRVPPDPPRHGGARPARPDATSRAGSGSGRTSRGSDRSSRSTWTCGGSAGRSWRARPPRSARRSCSRCTTPAAASSRPSTRSRPATRSATSGNRCATGATCTWARRARASSRSSRPASRTPSSIALPDPIPGRTPLSKARLRDELDGGPGARLRRQPRRAVRGGGRGVGADPRCAAAGSSATSSRRWPDNRTDAAKERHAGVVVGARPAKRCRAGSDGTASRRWDEREESMTEPIRIGIVGAGRIVAVGARPPLPRHRWRRARRRGQSIAGVVAGGGGRPGDPASRRRLADPRRGSRDRCRARRCVAVPPRAGDDRRARGRQARPDRGADGGDRRRCPGDARGLTRPPRSRRDGRARPRSRCGPTARSGACSPTGRSAGCGTSRSRGTTAAPAIRATSGAGNAGSAARTSWRSASSSSRWRAGSVRPRRSRR